MKLIAILAIGAVTLLVIDQRYGDSKLWNALGRTMTQVAYAAGAR